MLISGEQGSTEPTERSGLAPDVLVQLLALQWQDFFQTRQQTWRTLQIEAAIAVALVGIDWQLDEKYATAVIAAVLAIAAYFGARITIHHRNGMIQKYTQIHRIRDELGVASTIFAGTALPARIGWREALDWRNANTSLFILRMHIVLIVFAGVYGVFRILD